jgi:hypothetical protein
MRIRKMIAGGVAGTALMVSTASMPVAAQPRQSGLVNVEVGDITILENVGVGVAAQVAAQVCGVNVGPVAVLGTAVVRGSEQETVCEIEQGDQDVPVSITR